MKRSSLFAIWGIMYIICAGLGFIPDPQGAVRYFLILVEAAFFIPPAVLLWDARKTGHRSTLLRIRLLSALSLGLTVALLIANIFSVFAAPWLGDLMHVLLVLLTAPMLCGNFWALSLFCWAALLFGTFVKKE